MPCVPTAEISDGESASIPCRSPSRGPARTRIQATLFPAEQYSMCPVELMPLSYDWSALNAKIDAMYPNGFTNQTIGLQWGFQVS